MFAPSGEALDFGSFSGTFYFGARHTPAPVALSGVWGGLELGVLPSLKLADSAAGAIEIGGVEAGVDAFGPADDGNASVAFNFKMQLLKETTYLPAVSVGLFQVTPDLAQGAMLGFFALSKTPVIGDVDLGQFTFGMMTSFASTPYLVPQCFSAGAPYCLFRGSEPFEDGNVAFIAGYQSPHLGPMGLSVDYVGGTSVVSSVNVMVSATVADMLVAGAGLFFSNDRRGEPAGPAIVDGFFVAAAFTHSLPALLGLDGKGEKEPSGGQDGPPPKEAAPVAP